ncbi:MAG: urease accessory protein UreE [Hyphomicrobiaceae bacterium]
MKKIVSVVRKSDIADRTPIDSVTLEREGRYRRRIAMTSDSGERFLLDLAKATYLAPGDALAFGDGSLIAVKAAPEDLLEVRSQTPFELLRLAWHLGNRHTPAEITPEAIYIQYDHVLADMLAGLGAALSRISRPFEPEGGAYGGHGALQHGHHHGNDAASGAHRHHSHD